MMELLVVGTLWFWIVVSIAAIFIIYSLDTEDWGGTGATVTLIITSVLIWIFGGDTMSNIFSYISDNPMRILGFLGIYALAGVAWSFVKWYFYLLGTKERLLKDGNEDIRQYDIPTASDNKGRLIAWMTYWPFSAVWTIINDPIKRFFKFLFGRLENVFQKMSDRMFADVKINK